ncbi:hypothetical protein C5167_005152 [Papaver somniferum]|uniref:Uncharacterized protein n=1 Tax=Papaver somniferum TaxID=3469 RepID=A0A4Y7JCX7_PAPSO|nr:hypothetical protein C5167_005152 [Papaver somniferum]
MWRNCTRFSSSMHSQDFRNLLAGIVAIDGNTSYH